MDVEGGRFCSEWVGSYTTSLNRGRILTPDRLVVFLGAMVISSEVVCFTKIELGGWKSQASRTKRVMEVSDCGKCSLKLVIVLISYCATLYT